MAESPQFELPHYPALAKCLLIDARHASRTDIAKDLKATLLFDQVYEAKSLSDALTIVEFNQFDAMFVGPSVSLDKAREFIGRAKTRAQSKEDIAIIGILHRSDEANEPAILESGAHGVVFRPSTKLLMADGVIRAVVKANGNGAWAGIFKTSGHENAVIPDPFKKKEKEKAPEPAPEPKKPEPAPKPPSPFELVAETAANYLKGLQEGMQSGEFRLDPGGHPTLRTKEEIEKALQQIVDASPSPDMHSDKFKSFLEQAITEWFIDLIEQDESVAKARLISKLAGFEP